MALRAYESEVRTLAKRVHTYIYKLSRIFVNHKKGLEDEEIDLQVVIL